jgi:hypothetical protein
MKNGCRAASSSNITLSAPGATIGGVTMVSGDRFLAYGQTTGSENGFYTWNGAAVAATRSTDADTSAEMTQGVFSTISEGTGAGKIFILTTSDPIVLGATSLTFTQATGGGGGSTPTGTGFPHITGGVQDAAAVAIDLATAHVTGVLPAGNRAAPTAAEVQAATAALASSLDVNGQKVTNSQDATTSTGLATKGQMDTADASTLSSAQSYALALVNSKDIKDGVRAGSSTNLALTAPGATIGGVTMTGSGVDRFLAYGQTLGAANGIYVWNGAASPATRATDADTSAEVTQGMLVPVAEGTDAGKLFELETADPITLGVTVLTFGVVSPAITFALINSLLATANADISVNSQKITNLTKGTADTDAAAYAQLKDATTVNPVTRVTTAISRTSLSSDSSVDVTADATTQTLEASPATNRRVRFLLPSSNTGTTFSGNGHNINGAATYTGATGAYDVIDFEYNGTEWRLV